VKKEKTMGELRSVDEALDFAIQREIEANRFYMELAGLVENPAMCKVFEGFAKEELGHKARLEALKNNKMTALKETTLNKKVINLKIADFVEDVEPVPNMSYQEALIIAMKREKASFRLYTDLADAVTNQVQKDTFLLLAQEEAKHKLRFELEYDDVILKEN
jgi:rubrerythrin